MNNSKLDTNVSGSVSGIVLDIHRRTKFPGRVNFVDGMISSIERLAGEEVPDRFILPGFVDSHIHVESSLLAPTEMARMAVCHGTVATVSDPHEIANVCGVAGVEFMLKNAALTPFKFAFGAPSCVPATNPQIETAGAQLGLSEVAALLVRSDIYYLSEVMNFPAVLAAKEPYMGMIEAALKLGKPVDGHFPGGMGADAIAYANAGISTDHECFTLEEALGKIAAGMKILIREGSAAKNYEALAPLLREHPGMVMFCSDDKHPHELRRGHINELVVRAISDGYPLWDVLNAACRNPVEHYKLTVGLLQPGDPADFIVVDDLIKFEVLQTYIDGALVAEGRHSKMPQPEILPINEFKANPITAQDICVEATSSKVRAVVIRDGQLVTEEKLFSINPLDGCAVSEVEQDLLKVVVLNRYVADARPAVGFVHGFKLKTGALASSVAHDSHNVIAVGVSDEEIVAAINLVVANSGGLSVVGKQMRNVLPLPIAGIMSDGGGFHVAEKYAELHQEARSLGSDLHDPLMTLSFLALPVIPSIKMTDQGLFDVNKFTHVPVFEPFLIV